MSGCSRRTDRHCRVFWLTALVALGGCVHGPFPYQPEGWNSHPIADSQALSRLQIMVSYGAGACTHSALRLESAGHGALLWDPGGGWGLNAHSPAGVLRRADVIAREAPTLADYVDYRWRLGDKGLEVFEWQLDEAQAARLYRLLTDGTAFDTDRAAWTCSLALGDLLQQHGAPALRIHDRHFLPHRMVVDLYAARPARVMRYRPASPGVELRLSAGAAADRMP
jgi:hypothetical protein